MASHILLYTSSLGRLGLGSAYALLYSIGLTARFYHVYFLPRHCMGEKPNYVYCKIKEALHSFPQC